MPEGVQTDIDFYGANAVPFKWISKPELAPDEVLSVGPAGTGKSVAWGKFLWLLCDMYPGTVIALVRKTRVSLNDSFLDTFENEVLWPDHPSVVGRTRAHRDKYVHPNGKSEIRLCGMDQPRRLFSTQNHVIFVNEMTELIQREWESFHRALRRPGGPPFKLLAGDANPDNDYHWAHRRFPKEHMLMRDGKLRLVSTHDDNPYLKTPEGKQYLLRMDRSLTGPLHDQLVKGVWGTTSGAIYTMYRSDTHEISGRLEWPKDAYGETLYGEEVKLFIQRGIIDDDWEERSLRWFGAALDWGWSAPGCLGVWGFDSEKRGYEVAEAYYSYRDLDWWADRVAEAWQKFRMRYCVCDNDEHKIRHINGRLLERGIPAICVAVKKPPRKHLMFEHVRTGFKLREDGSGPSIHLLRDNLFAGRLEDGTLEPVRDPRLDDVGLPCCTAEEAPALVHAKHRETERGSVPQEESDEGCADHGLDQLGYNWLHAWRKDLSRRKKQEKKTPLGVHPSRLETAQELGRGTRRERRGL